MAKNRRASNADAEQISSGRRRRSRAEEGKKPNETLLNSGSIQDLLGNILLLGVPALLVAATIIPSESAYLGSGLLLVMLWILLFVLWAARSYLKSALWVRFNIIDLLILGTVAWHGVSTFLLVTGKTGHARPAINLSWEWLGFGICYFLCRQLFTTYRRHLALLMIMVCLATTLASCGLYQYFHTFPNQQLAYANASETEKQKQMEIAGIQNRQPGSQERMLFENRLASREPLATFGLTNSLAGFLSPWIIVAFGFGAVLLRYLKGDESRGVDQSMLVGLGIALVLMVSCLVLTKSRTAYVATGIATLMIILTAFAKSDSLRAIVTFGIVGLLGIFAIFAYWIGGVDAQVISEAPLSVKYRLEYWNATASMIKEFPMFGVGPGNFQTCYVKYQLPQASEEIADPHNFLFEIAATVGLPALLMFAGGLALWFFKVFPAARKDAEQLQEITAADRDRLESENDEIAVPHHDALLFWGALIGLATGLIFAYAADFSPSLQTLLIGTVPGAIVAVLFVSYMRSWRSLERLPVGRWVVAAAIAFFVNLLAAGGIGFPGVSLSGFVLLAIGLNVAGSQQAHAARSGTTSESGSEKSDDAHRLDRPFAILLFIVGIVLGIGCQFTAIRPVMASRPLLAKIAKVNNRPEADRLLEQLKRADPYNGEIGQLGLQFAFQDWAQGGYNQAKLEDVEIACRQAIEAEPRNSLLRRQIGILYIYAAERTAKIKYLEAGIDHLLTTTQMRPSDSLVRVELAWAYLVAGSFDLAKEQAAEAARLDKINTHLDKRLANFDLFEGISAQRKLELSGLTLPHGVQMQNAEQWVEQMRKMEVSESVLTGLNQ